MNLYFLKYAVDAKNTAYLEKVVFDYRPEKDPSMGSFYDKIFNMCNEKGIILKYAKVRFERNLSPSKCFMKKAPGMVDFNEEDRSQIAEAYKGLGEKQAISGEIIRIIAQRKLGTIYDPLLEIINEGRISIKVDNLGEEHFYQPRFASISREMGGLFVFIPIKDDNSIGAGVWRYEIHISRKIWDEKGNDANFLAEVLVYIYIINFLPRIEGLRLEAWAALSAQHFASEEARKKEVNDLNLYYFNYAVKNKKVRYLYDILREYRIFRDPQGTFKKAVYEALREIECGDSLSRGLRVDPLIEAIRDGNDLLAYYGYLFEVGLPKEIAYCQRVAQISRKLNEFQDSNAVIKANLQTDNNKYLFKYLYNDTQILYLPQNIGAFLTMKKIKSLELSIEQQNNIRAIEIEVEDFKEKRKQLQQQKRICKLKEGLSRILK